MSAQLDLLAEPQPEGEAPPRLTARQQLVWDALQAAGWDGLHTEEAGAIAHEAKAGRWQHSREARCEYCGRDGKQILGALRAKGLARYRGRMRIWQAAGTSPPEVRSPMMLRDDEPLPF